MNEVYKRVLMHVSRIWQVDADAILSKSRKQELCIARSALCRWLCYNTRLSHQSIAEPMGRDRTTITHTLRVFSDLHATNVQFRSRWKTLCDAMGH